MGSPEPGWASNPSCDALVTLGVGNRLSPRLHGRARRDVGLPEAMWLSSAGRMGLCGLVLSLCISCCRAGACRG